MASELEEIEIAIACQECGNSFLKSVRLLKAHHQLACSTCEAAIQLDDHGFRDAVLDTEKSIARILEGFPGPA